MAGQNVSKAQMLDLLGRLANDDGFRDRFEKSPPTALSEVGIPPNQIRGFPEDHTQPGKLASKAAFAQTLKQLQQNVADDCLCMVQPGLWLNYGDSPKKP
jgi:putative modified peptide